jgi:hypothetical protein
VRSLFSRKVPAPSAEVEFTWADAQRDSKSESRSETIVFIIAVTVGVFALIGAYHVCCAALELVTKL